MKKKNITFAILLMAVIFTAFNVSKTYARYVTVEEGTATASIATWDVAITGDEPTDAETFTLSLEGENDDVLKDKLAPDSMLTGTVHIDLTNTEVSVDVFAELGTITGVTNTGDYDIALYNGEVKEANKINGAITKTIGNSAFAAADGFDITVALIWKNDDEHSDDDTALGITGGDITANITITAQQHIGGNVEGSDTSNEAAIELSSD